jgi:hypothetical protein
MRRQLQRIAGLFLLAVATLGAADKRINLFPKLQPGQTITYLIRFQSDKTVKTESKVVAPMAPNAAQIDAVTKSPPSISSVWTPVAKASTSRFLQTAR